jgi:two-component system, OmpR family, phosphate regulon sensor histidine kinase PhoR
VNLTQRLLTGSLALVAVLVAAIVIIAGRRLNDRLARETDDELRREAELIGIAWSHHPSNPDSLADAAGKALERRVTLIDSNGVVVGDARFSGDALRRLENHSKRPEVVQARASGIGHSVRTSASAGDEEMYVALRHPLGFVRVSIGTARFHEIVGGAQRDVMIASTFALIGAIVLATLFSMRVSRPIVELRDVTRAIAAGDLTQRPSLSAPGEVGDLAAAVSRMTEELGLRLRAMEAEDARLLAIIEALDEGIIAVDGRGDVVRMNEAARRMFGSRATLPFPAAELQLDAPFREAMVAASRGERSEGVETTIADRIVSLTARPLPGGGVVLAVIDLTERRRLETVRRDFVANVSHELKTPLTVIAGFAETLRDPQLADADRVRFIDLVATNTTRMQRIVDDLLDLSRYESSSWTPHPVDIDLVATIDDLFSMVRSSAAEKNITLASEIDPATRSIRVDPTALRQVLSNLIENAIRYTSSGAVTVKASPDDGGGVTIAVTDTGIGISAEHLSRIFERFYRADPARSRADGGTGLGLAIVRHLVEAHRGRVTAESTPGVGTTVFVSLPRSAS